MASLVSALGAFSLWLIVHLVVWRLRKPVGQYVALGGLCLAVLVFALTGLSALQPANRDLGAFLPSTALGVFNFTMLYAALALAYLVTYSAVQADSPTMTILLRVGEAGPTGLSLDEILAQLNDDVLVVPRLEDLVVGKLVRRDGGRYVIGPRGALLARTYICYRALLGMEKGG